MIMPEEIAKHIDHEDHRAKEVQYSSYNSMPKTLRISLLRSDWRSVFIHGYSNADEGPWRSLEGQSAIGYWIHIPDAKYHNIIVIGSATM